MPIDSTRATFVAGLLLLACAGHASAEANPWSLGAGLTLGRDNNVFRAPPDQAVADRYTTLSLDGGLDQTIGRQRVQANASVRDNRYEERSDLDYRGYGLLLAWNGSTEGRLSGSLSFGANRNLASYANALTQEARVPNVETSRQANASAQLGLVSEWVAGVSLGHRTLDYSAESYAPNTLEQDNAGVSLIWRPLGPLSLSLGPRRTIGRYPKARQAADGSFDAERFTRNDVDLGVNWSASGASVVSARISSSRQRYDLLRDRDFSGTTGQFGWQWQPGGRTRINTVWLRDTGSESSFFTLGSFGQTFRGTGDSSQSTTALNVSIDYAFTGKISLAMAGTAAQRRLVSSSTLDLGGSSVDLGGVSGKKRSASLAVGLRYAPLRSVALSCDAAHGRRRGVEGLSTYYRFTAAWCSAQLSLQ